jgi:hypothetical protein
MKVNYQSNPMLKNKIEKIYIKLKGGEKNNQPGLTCQTRNPSHEIRITL